jgi:hypothetical protein
MVSDDQPPFTQLRAAGAAAREMLIRAAAAKWRVEPLSCTADQREPRGAYFGAPLSSPLSVFFLGAFFPLLSPPVS